MAAKKMNVHAKPLATRWEFASPEILAGVPTQLRKETLEMLTNEEIREELEENRYQMGRWRNLTLNH